MNNIAQEETGRIYEYVPCEKIAEIVNSSHEWPYEAVTNGGTVVTYNGRPAILMLDLSEIDPEYINEIVARARAMKSFERIRRIAESRGWMTDEEIEEEIAAARQERRETYNCESSN